MSGPGHNDKGVQVDRTPEVRVVKVRLSWWPRWWRNPIRWWRWRKLLKQEQLRLDTDPLYRKLVEDEERAWLFGDDSCQ